MAPQDLEWYFVREGQQTGPIIGRALTTAQITPKTLVWCKGMPEWTAAIDTPIGIMMFGAPPPLDTPPQVVSAPPAPLAVNIPVPTLAQVLPPPIKPTATEKNSEVSPQERSNNFILRHWRGEYALAHAYWVNCFALSACIGGLSYLLRLADVDLKPLAWTVLLSFGFGYVAQVWQLVGLFRSLKQHLYRGGSVVGTIFGWFGLGLMVFSILSTSLITVFPQSAAMIEILRGDPAIGPLRIELLPSGTEIEISGGIPVGSAAEFRAFIEKTPRIKTLQLDCRGGRIYEATAIAQIVRERQMTTYVSHQCLSAATIVFLAGQERYVLAGARIGFHAASLQGLSSADSKAVNDALRDGMTAAGVTNEFAAKAQNTPNAEMWYPTVQELLAARVITGQTYGERFGVSSATLRSLTKTEETLLAFPIYKAIRNADSETFTRIVTTYRNMLERGATEGEAVAQVSAIITPKFQALLPNASNEAVSKMLDLWILIIDRCGESQPEEVLALLLETKEQHPRNMLRVMPNYPMKEEMALMTEVFLNAGSHPVSIDREMAATDLETVLTLVRRESTDKLAVLAKPNDYGKNPSATLDAFRLYFFCLRTALSDARRANILRDSLFSK